MGEGGKGEKGDLSKKGGSKMISGVAERISRRGIRANQLKAGTGDELSGTS